MKKLFSLILMVAFILSLALLGPSAEASTAETQQNEYPIVLVHGLAGFDEVAGIPYWGGMYNISDYLTANGYENFVAAVGPFSSNWDRACELYAQIKGGTVDYGKAHSEKYGHARYGRTYTAIYPEWGETDSVTGEVNKIHLIGHSMGGQTIRTLAQLLENGSAEERAATNANELSPLFNSQKKSWVSGILTVSTPHDGSSAAYALDDNGNNQILQQSLLFLGTVGGGNFLGLYDFYFDQWGLVRQPGESCDSFIDRVESSTAWQTSRDLANWDLKPEGAMALNSWVKAQTDIYYFSQTGTCTYKEYFSGNHYPSVKMNPLFWTLSFYIGSYTQTQTVPINSSWWENDGLVSVSTADGPHVGSTDQIVTYVSGNPQIGKWNYLGTITDTDHTSIVGILTTKDQRPLFLSYARLLCSLPN